MTLPVTPRVRGRLCLRPGAVPPEYGGDCAFPGGRPPGDPSEYGGVPPLLPPRRGRAPGLAPAVPGTYLVVMSAWCLSGAFFLLA